MNFARANQFSLPRRSLGAVAVAGGAALTLSGRRAQAAGELQSLTWNGYQEAEILGDYIAKYGEMPPVTYFGDLSEEFTMVQAGGHYDTVHVDLNWVQRWRDAGLIKPIDTSRISRWSEVFDEVKELRGVQLDGETYFVPCNWGTISLIVRTDVVDSEYLENPTWDLLWDERYKGRISTYDDAITSVIMAALAEGFEDPENLTPAELDTAIERLAKQRDLVRFYWSDATMLSQGLINGEIVAAAGWSSTFAEVEAAGIPVAYVNPREGAHTWIDGVCHCNTGEGDDDRFYDFVNAWLSPETGAFILSVYGYGHSNRNAYDLVDAATLEAIGMTDPLAQLSRGHVLQPIKPELSEAYTVRFEEMKAGF